MVDFGSSMMGGFMGVFLGNIVGSCLNRACAAC
jgi:hypothetical protein